MIRFDKSLLILSYHSKRFNEIILLTYYYIFDYRSLLVRNILRLNDKERMCILLYLGLFILHIYSILYEEEKTNLWRLTYEVSGSAKTRYQC